MIEINNLTSGHIDEVLLKRLGKHVLIQEGVEKEVEISLAVVEEDEIQRLNKIYREQDEPTDVLSFQGDSKFIFPPSNIKQLGEIVICPSQITKREQNGLQEVFIHGILHLLGYDHQAQKDLEIMEKKQKKYLTSFFKKYGSAQQ